MLRPRFFLALEAMGRILGHLRKGEPEIVALFQAHMPEGEPAFRSFVAFTFQLVPAPSLRDYTPWLEIRSGKHWLRRPCIGWELRYSWISSVARELSKVYNTNPPAAEAHVHAGF